jgi:hypothetical protein
MLPLRVRLTMLRLWWMIGAFCSCERGGTLDVTLKYLEIIADNLSKAGWSWGCVSAIDSNGRTTWIVDAHRDDGKRYVVRAEEKLTAFVELEAAIRGSSSFTRSCTVKRHGAGTETYD